MKWFRLYYEFATDPKIQSMSETLQRRYVMLLCLKGNGDLETITENELMVALRISEEDLSETKKILTKKNLIVSGWKIRTWEDRQFKSDDSRERVERYRNKMKRDSNVTVTGQETETETDKDKDKESTKNAITEINIGNKKIILDKKRPLADSTIVIDALKKIGLAGNKATEIYQQYGKEYLIRKIYLYEYTVIFGNGKIGKPLAWIQNAIKEDYDESDQFLEWLKNKKETTLNNPNSPYKLKELAGLI